MNLEASLSYGLNYSWSLVLRNLGLSPPPITGYHLNPTVWYQAFHHFPNIDTPLSFHPSFLRIYLESFQPLPVVQVSHFWEFSCKDFLKIFNFLHLRWLVRKVKLSWIKGLENPGTFLLHFGANRFNMDGKGSSLDTMLPRSLRDSFSSIIPSQFKICYTMKFINSIWRRETNMSEVIQIVVPNFALMFKICM